MCQKTGDGIRHLGCDNWILEKAVGKHVKFFRLPIPRSVTIRVQDEDEKNTRVSCCESSADDSPPIAR